MASQNESTAVKAERNQELAFTLYLYISPIYFGFLYKP